MGDILVNKYKDKIIVKDLNDLRDEFGRQDKINNFQDYITTFANNHKNKPLVLTGLVAEKCLAEMNDTDETFYTIDTDDCDVLRQRFMRQVNKLNERKEMLFDHWLKDNKVQDKISRFVDLNKWKANNKVCRTIHEKYGYIFMNQQSVLKTVEKLLNDLFI